MNTVYDTLTTDELKKVQTGFEQHLKLAVTGDGHRPPTSYLANRIMIIGRILERRAPFVPPRRKR